MDGAWQVGLPPGFELFDLCLRSGDPGVKLGTVTPRMAQKFTKNYLATVLILNEHPGGGGGENGTHL